MYRFTEQGEQNKKKKSFDPKHDSHKKARHNKHKSTKKYDTTLENIHCHRQHSSSDFTPWSDRIGLALSCARPKPQQTRERHGSVRQRSNGANNYLFDCLSIIWTKVNKQANKKQCCFWVMWCTPRKKQMCNAHNVFSRQACVSQEKKKTRNRHSPCCYCCFFVFREGDGGRLNNHMINKEIQLGPWSVVLPS